MIKEEKQNSTRYGQTMHQKKNGILAGQTFQEGWSGRVEVVSLRG